MLNNKETTQEITSENTDCLESLFQMKISGPNFKALKKLSKTKINPKDIYNLCISLIEKDDTNQFPPSSLQYIVNATTVSIAILKEVATWDKERVERFEKLMQLAYNSPNGLLAASTFVQAAIKSEADLNVGWNEVSELCNIYKKELENNCTCMINRWTFGTDVEGLEKSKNFQALLDKKEYSTLQNNFKNHMEEGVINAISLFKGGDDKEIYEQVIHLLPGLFLGEPVIVKDIGGNPAVHIYIQLVSIAKQPIKTREAQTRAFEALTQAFINKLAKEATAKYWISPDPLTTTHQT